MDRTPARSDLGWSAAAAWVALLALLAALFAASPAAEPNPVVKLAFGVGLASVYLFIAVVLVAIFSLLRDRQWPRRLPVLAAATVVFAIAMLGQRPADPPAADIAPTAEPEEGPWDQYQATQAQSGIVDPFKQPHVQPQTYVARGALGSCPAGYVDHPANPAQCVLPIIAERMLRPRR